MTITIGSDELILWLRKNGKAANIPNDQLGKDIAAFIRGAFTVNPGPEKPAYWPLTGKNIGEYELPQTAAQYALDTARLPELYEWLAAL